MAIGAVAATAIRLGMAVRGVQRSPCETWLYERCGAGWSCRGDRAVLRGAGARFALLHGSRAAGSSRADSDVDVAAWWPSHPPPAFEVLVAPGIDLVVLNGAPLELAGRIALHGRVLFDDDPPARIRWTATTRKIYADEGPRLQRSHHEFAEAVRRGR